MIFGRKLVDPETALWVDAGLDWLSESIGPPRAPLILPTSDFSTAGAGDDHATAQTLFDDVRANLDLKDHRVDLVRQTEQSPYAAQDQAKMSEIAGMFFPGEDSYVITYNPEMMSNRQGFVASLAHECAHLTLAPYQEGALTHEDECLTDLCVIHQGFGLFQIMGARAAGWSGYLRTETRLYALALYLVMTGQDEAIALAHLDRYCAKRLGKIFKDLPRF